MTENVPLLSDIQREAIFGAYRRANKGSKIKKPSLGNTFAEKHFYISPEAKGEYTGAWQSRPWQAEILNVMASFQNKELSWRKASRMGASKMMCALICQCAAELNLNVIMYQPTDDAMDRFVKSEIDPMFRDVKILQSLKLSNSKKYDTMSLKQLRGFMLHLLGGATPDNYRSRSADIVITDECSAFGQDIGGEGDSRALSRTRITESPFGKQINGSSPKSLPNCLISRALAEMDFVFKFHLPCPSCGVLQYMDYFDDSDEVGIIYDHKKSGKIAEIAATARYACVECKAHHSYGEMINAQVGGKWMTDDGQFYIKGGLVYSGRNRVDGDDRWNIGMDSNSLISPAFTFSDYVSEYIPAKRRYGEGSVGPMKTLVNNRKGLPWEESDTIQTMDHKLFMTEPYPEGFVPEGVMAVFSAADIQGDRIEVGTVGYGAREESWWLDYQVFPGDTNKHEVWQRLEDYWHEKQFTTPSGRKLDIFLHGIDHGGHWSGTVERFCKTNDASRFIPLKGRLGHNKDVVDFPRAPSKQTGCWLTMINTDTTKQIVQKRMTYSMHGTEKKVLDHDQIDDDLAEMTVQPGRMHFPSYGPGYELFNESFYKQMVSEVRLLKPSGVPEWVANGRNEVFDIASMNLALCRIAQTPRYGLDFDVDVSDQVIANPKSRHRKYDFSQIGTGLNRRR